MNESDKTYNAQELKKLGYKEVESTSFSVVEHQKTYEMELCRQWLPNGGVAIYHLYKVHKFDGTIVFVLAASASDAICQAVPVASSTDALSYKELQKLASAVRVPFLIHGFRQTQF